ncbi:RDD family protein [Amycolatopsis sp. PS_44_ISF1]|uniref:RDD family protein n=1 Tax=Amycolatopsis sp. PS_44_ISF1 TaxID=2974917 RepID=UPI0028E00FE0|nr:RDD family protein [Amycolatopsis sp. PS_44_ISF1]MDT8915825.1 RDD family protein [Amycolatopsis sp. PS_44_ISF1]
MARWTGEWLPGAGDGPATADQQAPRWRGERLGLPESGVGSAAGGGSRLLALIVDLVLASLVTAIFVRYDLQDAAVMQTFNLWSGVVWAAISTVSAAFFGFTPAMGMFGIRVARLDGASLVGLGRAAVRMVLTVVIIPAAVRNVDGRSWLDRLTGTVVVRMR